MRHFLYKITTKKEKRSDLIFLPEERETILELFTVRIFVGSSQNMGPGVLFFPIFFCLNFCRYSAVLLFSNECTTHCWSADRVCKEIISLGYALYSVYSFQCDLCDENYVGFTARHLHQCISEHCYSAIGKHLETQHDNKKPKIDHLFKVLKKCRSKFDCLIYEMLFIKDIKPSLNTKSDSICAKLFTWHFRFFFLLFLLSYFWVLYP